MTRRDLRLRPYLNLTVTILIAFTVVFAAMLSLAVAGFRGAAERAAIATANTSLAQTAAIVAARTNGRVLPILALARAAAISGVTQGVPSNAAEGMGLLALLAATPELRGVSVGWADGTLLQAVPAALVPAAQMPSAPAGTATMLVFSRPGTPRRWLFLDAGRHVLGAASLGDAPDPRASQWYLQARGPGVFVTTPYQLGLTRMIGLSISTRVQGGGVLALDITLADLSDFLRAQRLTPHSLAFLFSDLGILLASPDAAEVTRSLGARQVQWTTLASSGSPILAGIWDAYASGRLQPGQSVELAAGGERLLARLALVDSLENPPVLVAVAAPRADFTAALDAATRRGTLLAVAGFLAGFALIAVLSWRIARPLGVLTREAQAIRQLELTVPLRLRSHITEVQRLAEAVAAMKATLGSFAVYLPRDLLGQFLAAGREPRLGGERVALSVLFSDIQGFTGIAETLEPEELTRLTSAYFEEVTRELLGAGATIDKYIGDAVMAFWNAPRRDPSHAAHACIAALRVRAVTLRLASSFVARGWPPLPTRFGVHTGEAVVGNVGSSDRMAYTAMGAMVNLANRLEGLNKAYGTQILVSEATMRAAGAGFVFRPADLVVVKGSALPVAVFELLGVYDPQAPVFLQAPPAALAGLEDWRACVENYRAGAFASARAALAKAVQGGSFPLAEVYAGRLDALGPAPEPDWSPVMQMMMK